MSENGTPLMVHDMSKVPRAYPWVSKLLSQITAALAVIILAALVYFIVFQLGPTAESNGAIAKSNAAAAKSNAAAVEALAKKTAIQKERDACYNKYSTDVTEGNAQAIGAIAEDNGAIGGLVVLLAAQPRDPQAVDAAIQHVRVTAVQELAAAGAYRATVKARDKYEAAGRPLPCPHR